jgi:hypothetical protein
LASFGPPPLLPGESEEDYAKLLARIVAATKPHDAIEEIFVDDITRLQWDILRWHRFKTSMISGVTHKALKAFLEGKIDFELYRTEFEEELTDALCSGFPEDQDSRLASELAIRCSDHEADAIAEVEKILGAAGRDLGKLGEEVEAPAVAELVNNYAKKDAKATRQVEGLLAKHGVTLNEVIAEALAGADDTSSMDYLAFIERLDNLLIVAENRRNASLREIYRYRSAFGQALSRSVEDIEDAEYKVIEAQSSMKSAA